MMITDIGTFRKLDLGIIFATGNLYRQLENYMGEEISLLVFWKPKIFGALAK